MASPVAVAGLGIVSALGFTTDSFRDALLAGRSGIVPITGFDTSDSRATIGGEIQNLEPATWVAPMKLRRLDRTGVYAIAIAKMAQLDAGAPSRDEGDDRAGIVLGTWSAGGHSTQVFLQGLFRDGPSGAPALLFDSTVGNSAASLAALELKWRGPNLTLSHKEASSLYAIATAVDLLRDGRASTLLTGGVDAMNESFFKGHDRFEVLAVDTSFSERNAPFARDRAGFLIGEGGFGLWLQANGPARRGEILGESMASAAVPLNAWPDRPEPLVRVMRQAIADASLSPADIDVVYASANATTLDAVEAAALSTVFDGCTPVVTAIKGALGESGASGAAACAAALLCGAIGRVPPIAGLTVAGEEAARLQLAHESVPARGPIALVNSFASGGALASIVLRAGTAI